MRKIYKLYIGIILSVIAVACSDNLDSDKYFKDRRSLEDVFTDKGIYGRMVSTCLFLFRRIQFGSV